MERKNIFFSEVSKKNGFEKLVLWDVSHFVGWKISEFS